jgi:GTP-binding protein Era
MKSGFVAVVGWTNVGKSTLLNTIVGQKVGIVSDKDQTTRFTTSVIHTEERGQIVFRDTPGIHDAYRPLNEAMMTEARESLSGADLVLHLISPDVKGDEGKVRSILASFRGPRILVLNKIDTLSKDLVVERLAKADPFNLYGDIVPVSAATGENVDRLVSVCFERLPEGPQLYPEDQVSDRNERFFMGEIVREKVIRLTRQELPYATAVVIESSKWLEEKGSWEIHATIYVEKDSQKGIVIGAGGAMLKDIGTSARKELEKFLDGKVFLQLWVKVRRNWTKDARFLREIGYGEHR